MYIYAGIGINNVVEYFVTYDAPADLEIEPNLILVDAVDETWIQRKQWNAETQEFVDLPASESITRNSLEFTHIDSNGTKHWLDVFVNDLASNNVETATVSEVETYLSI